MDVTKEDGERGSKGVGRVDGKEVEMKGFSFWEERDALDMVMIFGVLEMNFIYLIRPIIKAWIAVRLAVTCRGSVKSSPFVKV